MENAILKIIENQGEYEQYSCAAEIAELMTAFIKWMTCNHIFRATNYSDVLYTIYGDTKEYTLEDLFTYWHTEIYKNNNHGRRN